MPDAVHISTTTLRTALTWSTVAPPLRAPLRWPLSWGLTYEHVRTAVSTRELTEAADILGDQPGDHDKRSLGGAEHARVAQNVAVHQAGHQA